MKRLMMMVVAVLLTVAWTVAATTVTEHAASQTQQKHQKQRAQIIGQGRNAAAAITDARSNAAKVAGTYSFTTVSQRTVGKGEDWTCILIIEFEVK